MGEYWIERAHQGRNLIASQGATNRDKWEHMKIQKKDEQIRYNEIIIDVKNVKKN